MRDAAPIVWRRGQATAGLAIDPHDFPTINIPQAERDGDLAIRQFFIRADDKALGLDDPPVREARLDVDRQILLDEGRRVLDVEQASRFQIGPDDIGDVFGHFGIRATDFKVRNGQRGRLEITLVDADLQLRSGRHGETKGEKPGHQPEFC